MTAEKQALLTALLIVAAVFAIAVLIGYIA
jgi:hypothetical protein